VTTVVLRDNDIPVCGVRDVGVWEAMDAYRAAFAAATTEELAGQGDAAYQVRQVALETVIAEGMRVCAVISIHRALLAGASVGELAHVLGSSPTEVAERWRGWADGQLRLNTQCPGLGVGRREYDQVTAALHAGSSAGSTGEEVGCRDCQGESTQIGSPRS
jgi:hypothetical protein